MSVLSIRKYGDPILRQKCEEVKEITPEIRQLIRDMIETMHAAPGAGLAASQVGVPLRICVIDISPSDRPRRPMALINPRITAKSERVEEEEGCLSLPGLVTMVKRYRSVTVEATNDKGFPLKFQGTDLLARALQHEIDHLDGKMYVDYLSLLGRKRFEQVIKKKRKEAGW